jgi:hypothetical protein
MEFFMPKTDLTILQNALPYIGPSEMEINKEFLGKVCKIMRRKIKQIYALFVEFRWIDENKIQKKLNKKIEEFDKSLTNISKLSEQDQHELTLMSHRVAEMKEICKIIKEYTHGTNPKIEVKVENIDEKLSKLETSIEEKIQKIKIDFFPNEKREKITNENKPELAITFPEVYDIKDKEFKKITRELEHDDKTIPSPASTPQNKPLQDTNNNAVSISEETRSIDKPKKTKKSKEKQAPLKENVNFSNEAQQKSISKKIKKFSVADIKTASIKKLTEATNKEELGDNLTAASFNSYKQNKIGISHRVSKFALSCFAYGGMLALPVVGGGYLLAKNIYNIMDLAFPPEGTSRLGRLIHIATSLGGVGGVDLMSRKIAGISPTKYIALGMMMIMTSAVCYAASQASGAVSATYDQTEREKNVAREKAHELLFTSIKNTFDIAAEELSTLNNPEDIMKAQSNVNELESKLGFFESQLASYELSQYEISTIMNKLTSVIKKIKKKTTELKIPNSKEDLDINVYNTQILTLLPKKDMRSIAVTVESKIGKPQTGIMHVIKNNRLIKTGGQLLSAGLQTVVPVLLPVIGSIYYPNLLKDLLINCLDATPLAPFKAPIANAALPLTAAGILGFSAWSAKKNFVSRMEKIDEEDKVSQKKHQAMEKAKEETLVQYKNIFSGIAQVLDAYHEEDSKESLEMVTEIASKMQIIEDEFNALGIYSKEEIQEILRELKEVIAKIR